MGALIWKRGFGLCPGCRDGICRGAGFGSEERTSKPPCPGCSHFLCSLSYNLFHIAVSEWPLPLLAASRLWLLPLDRGCDWSCFHPKREKKGKKKRKIFQIEIWGNCFSGCHSGMVVAEISLPIYAKLSLCGDKPQGNSRRLKSVLIVLLLFPKGTKMTW